MTRDEIVAHQERREKFLTTPLGAAFNTYERALEDCCNAYGQNASWVSIKELNDRMFDAKKALMPLLEEAAGLDVVGPKNEV